jgi:hypothetical protein
MHRAALTNSVHSSRSQNGEAGITTYTKSTRPYDALTVDSGRSRHFDSSAGCVDCLDKSRYVLNRCRTLASVHVFKWRKPSQVRISMSSCNLLLSSAWMLYVMHPWTGEGSAPRNCSEATSRAQPEHRELRSVLAMHRG